MERILGQKMWSNWKNLDWVQRLAWVYIFTLIISVISMYHYAKSDANAQAERHPGRGAEVDAKKTISKEE